MRTFLLSILIALSANAQTPPVTTTVDNSGNLSTVGSITAGAGGTNAGSAGLNPGTQTLTGMPANSVGVIAPTSITGQHYFALPAAGASSGQVLQATGAESSGITPTAWVTPAGSGSEISLRVSRDTGGTYILPNCNTQHTGGTAVAGDAPIFQLDNSGTQYFVCAIHVPSSFVSSMKLTLIWTESGGGGGNNVNFSVQTLATAAGGSITSTTYNTAQLPAAQPAPLAGGLHHNSLAHSHGCRGGHD